MRRRDQIDSQRDDSPLRAAPDAILLDTDGLTVDEVMCRVWRLVQGATEASTS
jgi:cytidylate kinase